MIASRSPDTSPRDVQTLWNWAQIRELRWSWESREPAKLSMFDMYTRWAFCTFVLKAKRIPTPTGTGRNKQPQLCRLGCKVQWHSVPLADVDGVLTYPAMVIHSEVDHVGRSRKIVHDMRCYLWITSLFLSFFFFFFPSLFFPSEKSCLSCVLLFGRIVFKLAF